MALPINERLKAVRTALNFSQREFCKGIYTSQSYYARLEQGKMPINDRIQELVCYKYGVNREYLKDGKGKIFDDTTPADFKIDQLYQIFNELNGLFQDYVIRQARDILEIQKTQKKGKKTP